MRRIGLVVTFLFAALGPTLCAQIAWTKQGDITARQGHAMAYDSARARMVVFGGEFALRSSNDTWEWDGAVWVERATANRPAPRNGHAMIYDPFRQRVVLFGGVDGTTLFGDTWEYDGRDWQLVATSGPQARYWGQLAFDAVSGRTLLFGGTAGTSGGGFNTLGDTWEWDGSTWVQLMPAQSPSPRLWPGMGYDPTRDRTVLFGGMTASGARLGDTWVWDRARVTWTSRAVSGPVASVGWRMSYDATRGVMLMIGQEGVTPRSSGLWSWDGSRWARLSTATLPRAFSGFTMRYDSVRQRAVLFGGLRGLFYEEATWEWDGTDWEQVQSGPGPRGGYRLAYDAARTRGVLIGPGTAGTDVWLRSGGQWTRHGGSPQTPWWEWPGFAFHAPSGSAVRFGGLDIRGPNVVDETWTWDGIRWQRRFPTRLPPARMASAMAADPVRGTVLLFGGFGPGYLDDTWEWDGTNWTQLQPSQSPPARMHHALAVDEVRQRIVLFGGTLASGGSVADTWEWDGQTWLRMQPAQSPPAASLHGLAYDAARQRVVLFGGLTAPEQTWEWDGLDWRQRVTAVAPRGRGDFAMGYDPEVEGIVVFGGIRSQPVVEAFADTWELNATEPSRFASFASGCTGTQGVPALEVLGDRRPWLGEALPLTVGPTPAVSAVVLSIGASKTTWQGFSLPLDLSVVGMNGCALSVSADSSIWRVASANRADFALVIPTDAALLGGVFFAQAWVSDAGANPLGVVMSDAVEGRVGTR